MNYNISLTNKIIYNKKIFSDNHFSPISITSFLETSIKDIIKYAKLFGLLSLDPFELKKHFLNKVVNIVKGFEIVNADFILDFLDFLNISSKVYKKELKDLYDLRNESAHENKAKIKIMSDYKFVFEIINSILNHFYSKITLYE